MEHFPLQQTALRRRDLFARVHDEGAYFVITEEWTEQPLAVLGPAVDLPDADTVNISELHTSWNAVVARVHETNCDILIARSRRPIAALRPVDRYGAEARQNPELWVHAAQACAAELAKRPRLRAGMDDAEAVTALAARIAYDLWTVYDRYGFGIAAVSAAECDVPRLAVNAAALASR